MHQVNKGQCDIMYLLMPVLKYGLYLSGFFQTYNVNGFDLM